MKAKKTIKAKVLDNGAMNILKRAVGLVSTAGAALTQPELGRMRHEPTNLESPGFSHGECQIALLKLM